MAQFDGEGFDDLVADLNEKGELLSNVADEILLAGGEVVAEYIKTEAAAAGLRDTGDMIDSTAPDKIKMSKGVKSVKIYPLGKDRKKVLNATKAFIHNFGSKKYKATHFFSIAVDKAEEPAIAAMAEIWYAKLNQ